MSKKRFNTEEVESKMINALTDAYCLLRGSDLGNRINGKIITERILDAIQCFHSEKLRMENEKEWSDHAFSIPPPQRELTDKEMREISRECSSLSNPEDFEY